MNKNLDVEDTAKQMVRYLGDHHFVPRDADGNDLQYGDDKSLRFKVGTVYGEVAVQIVRNGHADPSETIRILNAAQITEAKHTLDQIIRKHRDGWAGCRNPDCGQSLNHDGVCD